MTFVQRNFDRNSFQTVAQMTAQPLIVGQTVDTFSYTIFGDGGGGQYIIVPPGSGTADNQFFHDLVNGNQAQLQRIGVYNNRQLGGSVDRGLILWGSSTFLDEAISLIDFYDQDGQNLTGRIGMQGSDAGLIGNQGDMIIRPNIASNLILSTSDAANQVEIRQNDVAVTRSNLLGLELSNDGTDFAGLLTGTTPPEGNVSAGPASLYLDRGGAIGDQIYIKTVGTGNTGWVSLLTSDLVSPALLSGQGTQGNDASSYIEFRDSAAVPLAQVGYTEGDASDQLSLINLFSAPTVISGASTILQEDGIPKVQTQGLGARIVGDNGSTFTATAVLDFYDNTNFNQMGRIGFEGDELGALGPNGGMVIRNLIANERLLLQGDDGIDLYQGVNRSLATRDDGITLGNDSTFFRPIIVGSGSPEGVESASQGALFMRVDGADGSTLYTKSSSPTAATGWTALGSGSSGGSFGPSPANLQGTGTGTANTSRINLNESDNTTQQGTLGFVDATSDMYFQNDIAAANTIVAGNNAVIAQSPVGTSRATFTSIGLTVTGRVRANDGDVEINQASSNQRTVYLDNGTQRWETLSTGGDFRLRSYDATGANAENHILAFRDGAMNLYHNNVLTAYTTSGGFNIDNRCRVEGDNVDATLTNASFDFTATTATQIGYIGFYDDTSVFGSPTANMWVTATQGEVMLTRGFAANDVKLQTESTGARILGVLQLQGTGTLAGTNLVSAMNYLDSASTVVGQTGFVYAENTNHMLLRGGPGTEVRLIRNDTDAILESESSGDVVISPSSGIARLTGTTNAENTNQARLSLMALDGTTLRGDIGFFALDNRLIIQNYHTGGTTPDVYIRSDAGNVALFEGGNRRMRTQAEGIRVNGEQIDIQSTTAGFNAESRVIFRENGNTIMGYVGHTAAANSNIFLQSQAGDVIINAATSAQAIRLQRAGADRFVTSSNGAETRSTSTTYHGLRTSTAGGAMAIQFINSGGITLGELGNRVTSLDDLYLQALVSNANVRIIPGSGAATLINHSGAGVAQTRFETATVGNIIYGDGTAGTEMQMRTSPSDVGSYYFYNSTGATNLGGIQCASTGIFILASGRPSLNDIYLRPAASATTRVWIQNGGTTLASFGTANITMNNLVQPNANNAIDLGTAALRWRTIYSVNALNVSDEKLKRNIKPIDDYILDAWSEVNYHQFQWKDGKYKDLYQFGVIAQQIEEVFRAHGINPEEYGFFRKEGDDYNIAPSQCAYLEAALMRREIEQLKKVA